MLPQTQPCTWCGSAVKITKQRLDSIRRFQSKNVFCGEKCNTAFYNHRAKTLRGTIASRDYSAEHKELHTS